MNRLIFIVITLLLTACQGTESTEVTNDKTPSIQLNEEDYSIILPYEPGVAESYVLGQSYAMGRVNINAIESGMMDYAKNYFSPKSYYFSEGKYLDKTLMADLLTSVDEGGINPSLDEVYTNEEVAVKDVAFIIYEQDFLVENVGTYIVNGMTLGVVLDQTPLDTSDNLVSLSDEELIDIAKEVNKRLIDAIHDIKGLEKITIQVLNYKASEANQLTPGVFFYETFSNSSTVSNKRIDEGVYLMPSTELAEDFAGVNESFNSLVADVEELYPTYVSTIGFLKRMENQIDSIDLTVTTTMESESQQYALSRVYLELVTNYFPGNYDVTVSIYSNEKCQSVLYRSKDEAELGYINLK